MIRYRIEAVDRQRWRQRAASFLDYSYRQLWDFGVACARRVGAVSEHVATLDGDETIALADVRVKRIPIIGAGIAYINGGPLVRRNEPSDGQRLEWALRALAAEYVDRRSLVLRIAPALGPPDWNQQQCGVFEACGFGPADRVKRYRTLVLDLGRPLEAIRKSLDQKWRNCLNRSEKNGLSIRSGSSEELFESFCGLYRQLLSRKGFDVDLDAAFYATVQRDLAEAERFVISIADSGGHPVAGHVASMLGDTCVYLLGASNKAGMETKASYLLQWHTIQAARERGCRWYDLGGIDPDANPGTYHFKAGLGGQDVFAPGPFEIGPAGIKGGIVPVAERLHRAIHRP
ncbi:MAG: peptidoglycan bridge formation glycyltransferase FemA/FemB family protein [Phycisphaerae bacterium]|nr:peptidoglycan bridge formation glycyltransferase FemA/FemB family protein [Phycisphaerae bacterium]